MTEQQQQQNKQTSSSIRQHRTISRRTRTNQSRPNHATNLQGDVTMIRRTNKKKKGKHGRRKDKQQQNPPPPVAAAAAAPAAAPAPGSSTPPVAVPSFGVGGGTSTSGNTVLGTAGSTVAAAASAAAATTSISSIAAVGTITTTGSLIPIVTTPPAANRSAVFQGQLERHTNEMQQQQLLHIARLQKQSELNKQELELKDQEIDRLAREFGRVEANNAKKLKEIKFRYNGTQHNPHGPHAATAVHARLKAKMTANKKPQVCGAPPVATAQRPATGGRREGDAPAAQQDPPGVAPPLQAAAAIRTASAPTDRPATGGTREGEDPMVQQHPPAMAPPLLAAAIKKAPVSAEQRPASGGKSEKGVPALIDVGSTEISTSDVAETRLAYDPNAKPDDESNTFSMYGREVPAEIFTKARNQAFVGIVGEYSTKLTGYLLVSDEWYERIIVAAWRGCHDIAVLFYKNDPKYPESQFSRINEKCSYEFACKVTKDVSRMYVSNIVANGMEQLHPNIVAKMEGTDDVSTDKIEQQKPAITATGNQLIVPYSKIDGLVAGDGNMVTASINTTVPRNADVTDEEKKPAAQPEYTTDNHEIVRPSVVVSPLASILASEQRLRGIFESHDYDVGFDAVMDMCISAESMIMLIANESDDSCTHGNTHGQYHMSRALEILMLLSEGIMNNGYDGPVALTTALAQQACIAFPDDTSWDPKFAQFLVSTVTNFIPIKSGNEGDHFVPIFMTKAVKIKHRLKLNNALISNNEDLHVGLRHLYGHKLLKDKRDVVSERRVINVCYRETKGICDCMKQLRLACKTGKHRPCFGCRKLFPKMELLYCAGCGLAEYCSYECSKKDWVEGKHKYVCAKKDYTRCNACRVIFPSNEQAVHTCITGPDSTIFEFATNYVTTIKERFTDEPEKYKTFVEILGAREQLGHTEVIKEVSVLLEEHPDLLNEFTFFHPDAAQSEGKEQLKIFAMVADERRTRK